MAFCVHCGASGEGAFCPSCGKPLSGGAAAGGGGAAPAGTAAGGMTDNVAGALCYLVGVITGILFLVLEPYNRNREIRFHAFQSIFLNVAWIVLLIVLGIVSAAIGMVVPVIGTVVIGLLSFVVWIGFLLIWVILMVKTFNGSKWVLPVIGPLAQKQAG
jgi:uncharacterized membrane protein